MEHHGENPPQNIFIVIPARYESSRLPGKLLLPIAGKSLILHTLEQAKKAANITRVIVATDDERIFNAVVESGSEAVMTSPGHRSGSDRIAEVAAGLPEGSIIVNVQGDEPTISPRSIEKAVDAILNDSSVDISTTCEKINSVSDLMNPNVVKVVASESGDALYFSRLPVPFPREAATRNGGPDKALENEPELLSIFRKHTGLYVYRREYLLQFAKMPQTKLEKIEMLEQLRALENGAKIKVVEVHESSVGVDTQEDFERVRSLLTERAVSLREATDNDIPAIARVYVESVRQAFTGIGSQSYLNGLSAERREKIVSERFTNACYRSFVAENGEGRIVGFIDCGKPLFNNLPHERQVFSFYLLPDFQRKGIGRRLFKACAAEIVEEGCNSLCLDTLEASPYRKFYENMGGSVVGNGTHRIGDEDFATVIYGWDDLQAL